MRGVGILVSVLALGLFIGGCAVTDYPCITAPTRAGANGDIAMDTDGDVLGSWVDVFITTPALGAAADECDDEGAVGATLGWAYLATASRIAAGYDLDPVVPGTDTWFEISPYVQQTADGAVFDPLVGGTRPLPQDIASSVIRMFSSGYTFMDRTYCAHTPHVCEYVRAVTGDSCDPTDATDFSPFDYTFVPDPDPLVETACDAANGVGLLGILASYFTRQPECPQVGASTGSGFSLIELGQIMSDATPNPDGTFTLHLTEDSLSVTFHRDGVTIPMDLSGLDYDLVVHPDSGTWIFEPSSQMPRDQFLFYAEQLESLERRVGYWAEVTFEGHSHTWHMAVPYVFSAEKFAEGFYGTPDGYSVTKGTVTVDSRGL